MVQDKEPQQSRCLEINILATNASILLVPFVNISFSLSNINKKSKYYFVCFFKPLYYILNRNESNDHRTCKALVENSSVFRLVKKSNFGCIQRFVLYHF